MKLNDMHARPPTQRQTHRHRQTDRHRQRERDRQRDRQRARETDRETERQRWRDRQRDRRRDRQTGRIKEKVNDNDQARAVQAKGLPKNDSLIAKPLLSFSRPIETKINFGREIEKEEEREKGHLVN